MRLRRELEAPGPSRYLENGSFRNPARVALRSADRGGIRGCPSSSASEERLMNRRLGDFEIIREVGRGGMGVVYEAWQVSLNRKVALKVLSAVLGLTSNAVARFRREAEAAARLHHTNIVPVYATGEQDGTHFYAMEFIE